MEWGWTRPVGTSYEDQGISKKSNLGVRKDVWDDTRLRLQRQEVLGDQITLNLTICPRCRLNVCPASLALGDFLSVIMYFQVNSLSLGLTPPCPHWVGMGRRPVSSSPGYLQCVVQGWLHDQTEIRLFFEISLMDVGGRESPFSQLLSWEDRVAACEHLSWQHRGLLCRRRK